MCVSVLLGGVEWRPLVGTLTGTVDGGLGGVSAMLVRGMYSVRATVLGVCVQDVQRNKSKVMQRLELVTCQSGRFHGYAHV